MFPCGGKDLSGKSLCHHLGCTGLRAPWQVAAELSQRWAAGPPPPRPHPWHYSRKMPFIRPEKNASLYKTGRGMSPVMDYYFI